MQTNLNKICFLLNFASHYRLPIFKALSNSCRCDMYFGERTHTSIKKFDYSDLENFISELKVVFLFKGIHFFLGLITNRIWAYNKFVLTGDPRCLSNWMILLYAKALNRECYLWTHGWYGKESKLERRIKLMFFKLSSGLFLYGNFAKKQLIDRGIDEKKLYVIYNSLDFEKQAEIMKDIKSNKVFNKRFDNNFPTIIYVGRVQKVKGIDKIFEAVNLLGKENIYVNLMIVGKEIDFSINSYINKNNVDKDRFWYYGSCYDEKLISQFFYDADVTVSPGNVGLTAIHSLTYGTPVITHDNFPEQMPEFEVIRHKENGYFYSQGDIRDLANAIKFCCFSLEQSKKVIDPLIRKYYNPEYQARIFKEVLKC